MGVASLERLQHARVILSRRDAPIDERLARAYLFGLAWIYPDASFAGHEREFDALREELGRLYYGNRAAIKTQHLVDLERRVLALCAALIGTPIDTARAGQRSRFSS